jgi:hypothetical protein
MKPNQVRALLGLLGFLALAACGDTKYQCDVYTRSPYQYFASTWYRTSSVGEATTKCENEHPGYDCVCYEDH